MRIVLVIHHEADGVFGAEGVTRRIAHEWTLLGHDVQVLSFSDLPPSLRRGRLAGLAFPWYVAWVLRRSDADLVDASTGDTWLLGLLLRRRRDRPFLAVRSHGLEHLAVASGAVAPRTRFGRVYFLRYRLWEVRTAIRQADVFRALNEREADAARRLGAKAVVVGANGVAEPFLESTSERPDPPPLQVAVIGRWEDAKGSAETRELAERLPDVRFHVLGAGDSPVPLPSADVVPRCTPEEMAAALAQAHVYLSFSHTEGFSLALVEAMACGAVPVVTQVGAAPEVVADGGVLLEVGDVAGAETALRSLIADPARWRAFSERARRLGSTYPWSDVAAGTIISYEAVGLRERRREGSP